MSFYNDKLIFYHIPKTGGRWVKYAMQKAGTPVSRSGGKPGKHRLLLYRIHKPPSRTLDEYKKDRFSFAFVRHPLNWYRSFWAYRKMSEDKNISAFPLDFAWDSEFERFVSKSLEMFREGFLTEVYKEYVGDDGRALDFIGRQENLRNDLVKALNLAKVEFNEDVIRNLKRINVAAQKERFKDSFGLSKKIEKKLLDRESWIIDKFYE